MRPFIRNRLSQQGFTLIEVIIVITIIGILFAVSYIPYDHYSRISRIRISSEKVGQAMESARILAQNGQIFPGTDKNANIGLVFEKDAHAITMLAFSGQTRSFSENENSKILKIIKLEDGIHITKLPENKVLLEYTAPKGDLEIYHTQTLTGTNFTLGIGFKTSTSGPLYREISIDK